MTSSIMYVDVCALKYVTDGFITSFDNTHSYFHIYNWKANVCNTVVVFL
jgi:hypothetical protein